MGGMIWKSLRILTCPLKGVINLSMWMHFFKDRNPNNVMVMNTEDGEYFIINDRRSNYDTRRI